MASFTRIRIEEANTEWRTSQQINSIKTKKKKKRKKLNTQYNTQHDHHSFGYVLMLEGVVSCFMSYNFYTKKHQ